MDNEGYCPFEGGQLSLLLNNNNARLAVVLVGYLKSLYPPWSDYGSILFAQFITFSSVSSLPMAGRVLCHAYHGARAIPLIIAEEVREQGFRRLIDATDPKNLAQTGQMVANAFNGSTMLTESQKARVHKMLTTDANPRPLRGTAC
jgi:hypothetical protein